MPAARNSRAAALNANKRSTSRVPAYNDSVALQRQPPSSKINLEEYEEVEDEYGFRYMRKKQKTGPIASVNTDFMGTPTSHSFSSSSSSNINNNNISNSNSSSRNAPHVVATAGQGHIKLVGSMMATANYAASPSTPTPSKQVLENNRRKRRSSFAVLAAAAASNGDAPQAGRHSSIGMSLTHTLPPTNVPSAEYHKHLLPDLPGPVKMRQLLIWACQRASTELSRGSVLSSLGDLSDELVQGLFKCEIETSWYQRPANDPAISADSVTYLPNPQNQEIRECIELYRSYQSRLQGELAEWQRLETDREALKENVTGSVLMADGPSVQLDEPPKTLLSPTAAITLANMNAWLARDLPLSVDRLDWTCKLATSFQDHAKHFCDSVFQEIFAKFFANAKEKRVEPMLVLRAMSQGA